MSLLIRQRRRCYCQPVPTGDAERLDGNVPAPSQLWPACMRRGQRVSANFYGMVSSGAKEIAWAVTGR
jgi:hypothetical protein